MWVGLQGGGIVAGGSRCFSSCRKSVGMRRMQSGNRWREQQLQCRLSEKREKDSMTKKVNSGKKRYSWKWHKEVKKQRLGLHLVGVWGARVTPSLLLSVGGGQCARSLEGSVWEVTPHIAVEHVDLSVAQISWQWVEADDLKTRICFCCCPLTSHCTQKRWILTTATKKLQIYWSRFFYFFVVVEDVDYFLCQIF